MEEIIEQKKASSFTVLILFFVFTFIGVFVGHMIIDNKDLIGIIAYTVTFLGLFFYFQLKKGVL